MEDSPDATTIKNRDRFNCGNAGDGGTGSGDGDDGNAATVVQHL